MVVKRISHPHASTGEFPTSPVSSRVPLKSVFEITNDSTPKQGREALTALLILLSAAYDLRSSPGTDVKIAADRGEVFIGIKMQGYWLGFDQDGDLVHSVEAMDEKV